MTTRIAPGVGANLLGQHSAERNQDATAYVGNLDPQVPFSFFIFCFCSFYFLLLFFLMIFFFVLLNTVFFFFFTFVVYSLSLSLSFVISFFHYFVPVLLT